MIYNFLGNHIDLLEVICIHTAKSEMGEISVNITFSGIFEPSIIENLGTGDVADERVKQLIEAYYEAKSSEYE